MSDGIKVDVSEVNAQAASLGRVPAVAGRYLRSAVETTARHIRDDWNEDLYREGHAKFTGYSVDYDIGVMAALSLDFSYIRAEIGPNLNKRQAAIAGILETGSVTTPPHGAGAGALEKNREDFERGLIKALADAERVAGIDRSISGQLGAVLRGRY